MRNETLEIDKNQFILTGKPGIQLLHQFQIHSDPELPQGLAVRIRGKSAQIQVGIDRQFPVNSIQANFLTKYLSRDAISTLLAFCAALIGYLLPWLATQDNS